MEKGIATVLIVVPLAVICLGLAYYGVTLAIRKVQTPRQHRRYSSEDGMQLKNINLRDAGAKVLKAYRRWGAYYEELMAETEGGYGEEYEDEEGYEPSQSLALALPPAALPPSPAAPVEAAAFTVEQLGLGPGLYRLLEEKALIVLGPKGSGKTTFAVALLHGAAHTGRHVMVIDPHGTRNDWPDELVIRGNGLDYDDADRALVEVYNEMRERYRMPKGTVFEHLYVFIDEVPSLSEECEHWRKYISRLLREARKVNIHIVLLSQSFLVEDLNLNGATRENFTVVALGKARRRYVKAIPGLTDAEKQVILEALRGYDHLAVIDDGDIPVLHDQTGANLARTRRPILVWGDEGNARSKVSNVSDGNPFGTSDGTSVGTSEVPLSVGTSGNPSSNAGSNGFREPLELAWRLFNEASEPEKRSAVRTSKLLTVEGREQAILHGFNLSSKGRAYSRAKELLDAFQLLEQAGLIT